MTQQAADSIQVTLDFLVYVLDPTGENAPGWTVDHSINVLGWLPIPEVGDWIICQDEMTRRVKERHYLYGEASVTIHLIMDEKRVLEP